MAQAPLLEFAKFLKEHNYTTQMWDGGYTPERSNGVCHQLTEWARQVFELPGEFLMLWSEVEGTQFTGDSELVYFSENLAHLVPNPFIEGDAEGFVVALATIISGASDTLYRVPIKQRVLYNAV